MTDPTPPTTHPPATTGADAAGKRKDEDTMSSELKDVPVGAKAPAVGGGHWYRTTYGWKWNGPDGCGSTFPRPGGDWNGRLIMPDTTPPAELAAGKLYARRDTEALGEHYMRHLDAMTREDLHSKSDIAAELAHRDAELSAARASLAACRAAVDRRKQRERELGGISQIIVLGDFAFDVDAALADADRAGTEGG